MADDDVGPFDPVTLQPRDTPPVPGWLTPASRAPFPPSPPAQPAQVTGAPDGSDVVGMFRASEARRAETEAGRREQMEPMTDEVVRQLGRPVPEMPKLQKAPEPPKSTLGDDMRGWMQSAMVLAAIGGAIGRKHITNALTAFSGAVEGFKNGRLDDAKQKMEEWRSQSQTVQDNNKAMLDEYNAALKSQSADLDQKMNAVKLIASKWHDRAAYDAASTSNITELARYLQQLHYQNETMEIRRGQLDLSTRKLDYMIELQTGGRLSNGAKDLAAEMFMRSGKLPPNIGRGAQGRQDIADILERVTALAKAQGLTGEQILAKQQAFNAQAAGLRTAFTQEAKMGTAAAEAQSTFPMAREAMAALPRSSYLPINKLLEGYGTATQTPEQARALTATLAAVNAYAAVMGRGSNQVTVNARQEAQHLLSTAMSPEAYNASLDQMEKEMTAVLAAPEKSRERLLGGGARKTEEPDRTNDPALDESRDPFGVLR